MKKCEYVCVERIGVEVKQCQKLTSANIQWVCVADIFVLKERANFEVQNGSLQLPIRPFSGVKYMMFKRKIFVKGFNLKIWNSQLMSYHLIGKVCAVFSKYTVKSQKKKKSK